MKITDHLNIKFYLANISKEQYREDYLFPVAKKLKPKSVRSNTSDTKLLEIIKENAKKVVEMYSYATLIDFKRTVREIEEAYNERMTDEEIDNLVEYLTKNYYEVLCDSKYLKFNELKENNIKITKEQVNYINDFIRNEYLLNKEVFNKYLKVCLVFSNEKAKNKYMSSQSPNSASTYALKITDEISWGHKPEQSLRISDHWNFKSGGLMHCETEDSNFNDFAVAVYENGTYKVLCSI